MKRNQQPNQAAFDDVCQRLDAGEALDLEMVGEVFQQPFWIQLVYALMDAQTAARAIQGAIERLRVGDAVDGTD